MRLSALAISLCACGDAAVAPDAPRPDPDAAAPDAAWTFAGAVSGQVVSRGAPVEGATVRFGGRTGSTTTGADGKFTLVVEETVELRRLGLTAGKPGFFNEGVRVIDPAEPQILELEPIEISDNPGYGFKSPDKANAAPYCIHCHPHQVDPWSLSAHSGAARDPFLHDLYNGTGRGHATQAACEAKGGAWRPGKALGVDGTASKCYIGSGVLPDLNPDRCGGAAQLTCDDPALPPESRPVNLGPCTDCHAPAGTGHAAGATDLNAVRGVAFDKGIHCDFCHKIRQVRLNQGEGRGPGVAGAIELLRPGPPGLSGFSRPEVMFGPYDDVIVSVMGGTPQPQFRTSELCAGCHQWQSPAGLTLYDTYSEWRASTWADSGIHCQNCHMPAAPYENATVDFGPIPAVPDGSRGWPRSYGTVREHSFQARLPPAPDGSGPGDPDRDLLRSPLVASVLAEREGGTLSVRVTLTNTGCGHAIPTGSPFRGLLLLVEAQGPLGRLQPTGGNAIPDWAGALAQGEIGPDAATLDGTELRLPPGQTFSPAVTPGAEIRFTSAGGDLVAEALVIQVNGAVATLDRALVVPDEARFFAGSLLPEQPAVDDELPSLALAGAAGSAFAKLMRDEDGGLGVPFWRAVETASDNRIRPGQSVTTDHRFDAALSEGSSLTVTVTLLHRKFPWYLAHERGWSTVDAVRLRTSVPVP